MGGGTWQAAVHGVAEGRTQLSDFTFTFHCHTLEKERATHSSVLAWRIPGTGEPGQMIIETVGLTSLPKGRLEIWKINSLEKLTFNGQLEYAGRAKESKKYSLSESC